MPPYLDEETEAKIQLTKMKEKKLLKYTQRKVQGSETIDTSINMGVHNLAERIKHFTSFYFILFKGGCRSEKADFHGALN